jgi:hypothetical protein
MITNNELEMILKKTVVAEFLLFRHLNEGTEENQEESLGSWCRG